MAPFKSADNLEALVKCLLTAYTLFQVCMFNLRPYCNIICTYVGLCEAVAPGCNGWRANTEETTCLSAKQLPLVWEQLVETRGSSTINTILKYANLNDAILPQLVQTSRRSDMGKIRRWPRCCIYFCCFCYANILNIPIYGF